MTPDEVVTRARELEGREVLLTVRGVVHTDSKSGVWLEADPFPRWIAHHRGAPCADLTDIQPAPVRIEAGQVYLDASGEAWRGISHGRVQSMDGEWECTPDGRPGWRLGKVVDA